MANECSKSISRRLYNSAFSTKYFKGIGVDIGAGTDSLGNSDGLGKYIQQFPLITSCKGWDIEDGDANFMKEVKDNTFDFVHSSHCLEHMNDPFVSLENWVRITKPKGYIITTLPDEDLYEQSTGVKDGKFYSNFNGDHKKTFTIYKSKSWSPVSINIFDLIVRVNKVYPIKIQKIELLDLSYQYEQKVHDQTGGIAECAIEFILQKL